MQTLSTIKTYQISSARNILIWHLGCTIPFRPYYRRLKAMKVLSIASIFGLFSVVPIHAANNPLATGSIDFVNMQDSTGTYNAVHCVAENKMGQRFTLDGQQRERAVSVSLKNLLLGDDGYYIVKCTAHHMPSREHYTAEFKAVKLTEGQFGNTAPALSFDENRKAYGIKLSDTGSAMSCYIPRKTILDELCLTEFYGSKPFYLDQVLAETNVAMAYNSGFSSHVGIFLKPNPRRNRL
ncbi:hypothetical protein ACUHMQ_10645 [Chitinimonas sp. PSY-7]|uniref:hypothetical protein n=1 Tax=Chitinimonas sp. PSY-7 TaxID=3459088 RepID=UPI00403FE1E3